jgi:hypothetical protein
MKARQCVIRASLVRLRRCRARERAKVREETPSRPRAHSNASVCRTLFLDSMSAAYFCLRTLAPLDVVDDDVIVDPAFSFSFISTRASPSVGGEYVILATLQSYASTSFSSSLTKT